MKISGPLSESAVYTKPATPNGAQVMIHRTTVVTASEMALNTSLELSLAERKAMPMSTAHARMPR